MDRDALVTRTRRLADVNFTDLWSATEVADVVNDAYLTIAGSAPWSFLMAEDTIATVDGTSDYSLPAVVETATALWIDDTTGRLLRRRAVEQFAWASDARSADAEPWGWGMVDDDTVRLFPTPDAVYTVNVRGWKLPAVLGASDEPVWASAHHVAVAYEAARMILETEGDDSGRAERHLSTLQWHLGRMAARYLPDGTEPIVWPPAAAVEG